MKPNSLLTLVCLFGLSNGILYCGQTPHSKNSSSPKTPLPTSFAEKRFKRQMVAGYVQEIPGASLGLAVLHSPSSPTQSTGVTASVTTSRSWSSTRKSLVVGSLAVATLLSGLLFGQIKYKMISRMFKAAPKSTKVSWLSYLTGISLR